MKNKFNSNLEKAIAHLKKIGFVVLKHPTKNLWDIHRIGHKEYCDSPKYPSSFRSKDDPYDYTERQLINYAKVYSAQNKQITAINRELKTSAKRFRNSRIKNALHSKDFDKLEEFSTIEPKETDKSEWD